MNRYIFNLLLPLFLVGTLVAQEMPMGLRGKWIVKKVLPTSTISCWGDKEAKRLIGTEIEYSSDAFRWKDKITLHPNVTTKIVTAQQFHDENSGGANDSQVSFRQLGIRAPQATQITFDHPPADITTGTTEIPGDVVLLKSRDAIVISACNIYFEARRKPGA